MFKRFLNSEAASGIIIMGSVALSMLLANTVAGPGLQSIIDKLHPLINDGLMSVFFLLVGLEIKRELLEGSLSDPKAAALPILCAVGGAIVPALIYFAINSGLPTLAGWGIPMATDIAFALAILGLLGKRVPASLKIFLAALAITDDLLAILVIAIFYAGKIQLIYLLYTAILSLLLFAFNRMKLTNLLWYLIPGAAIWYCIHHSGVHATIAGVITAMFIPLSTKTQHSPLKTLEHFLVVPVNYIIVPLFAFANTNIRLQTDMIAGISSPASIGIMTGLLIGKPLGILLTTFLATRSGIANLPHSTTWRHILGVGILAGIGFTMSIFMTLLSFSDETMIAMAKFAVLCTSLLAATIGYLILKNKAG